jgi:hypothetical protein
MACSTTAHSISPHMAVMLMPLECARSWRAQHITDRGKLTRLLQKEFSASRDSERKLDLGLLLTDVLNNT